MDTNTFAIVLETIAIIVSITVGFYVAKKNKKDLNGDDLLSIFIDNKDSIIKIVEDVAALKGPKKSEEEIKKLLDEKIELLLKDEKIPLSSFQKELISINKTFFINYLYDKVIE